MSARTIRLSDVEPLEGARMPPTVSGSYYGGGQGILENGTVVVATASDLASELAKRDEKIIALEKRLNEISSRLEQLH